MCTTLKLIFLFFLYKDLCHTLTKMQNIICQVRIMLKIKRFSAFSMISATTRSLPTTDSNVVSAFKSSRASRCTCARIDDIGFHLDLDKPKCITRWKRITCMCVKKMINMRNRILRIIEIKAPV